MLWLNGIVLSIATLLVAGPALADPATSIIDQFIAGENAPVSGCGCC